MDSPVYRITNTRAAMHQRGFNRGMRVGYNVTWYFKRGARTFRFTIPTILKGV